MLLCRRRKERINNSFVFHLSLKCPRNNLDQLISLLQLRIFIFIFNHKTKWSVTTTTVNSLCNIQKLQQYVYVLSKKGKLFQLSNLYQTRQLHLEWLHNNIYVWTLKIKHQELCSPPALCSPLVSSLTGQHQMKYPQHEDCSATAKTLVYYQHSFCHQSKT